MFLNLLMFNVRKVGQVEYNLACRNRILLRGENGSGKSTVKEGLIFALTGRDSSGGQCPTHLIARGENGLRVVLKTTEGWVIKRTLTLKKNSTLTLEKDNVLEFKVNNTDLLETLGLSLESLGAIPPDIYMSAVIPGFFMSQTSVRRFSMLSMILPQFDRAEYVSGISGYSKQDVMYM
jgi:recombinational DNA repair ATPase RecF